MKKRFVALVVAIIALAIASPGAGAQDPDDASTSSGAVISEGRFVVDRHNEPISDDADGLRGLTATTPEVNGPTRASGPMTATEVGTNLRFCFDATVPEAARSAAIRAARAWDEAIDFRGPVIEIDMSWTSFASSQSLGVAGPGSFVEHPDLPLPNHRYPVALANELLNVDFAPRPVCDSGRDPEVVLMLNASARGSGGSWHLGADAPPPGQIDLTSVIIHELAHGFGFTGSAERNDKGALAWPDDGGTPYAYDAAVSRCEQVSIDACGPRQLRSVALGNLAVLTGNALWFDAGLTNLELHAPATWDVGSSFSHLSEDRYDLSSGAALMTPFLASGERHTEVDHATTAVLQRMGWRLASAPASTRQIGLTPIQTGVNVTLGVTPFDVGPVPTSYLVRILRVDEPRSGDASPTTEPFESFVITDASFTISGLTGGQTYRLAIQGLNPAGRGPIITTASFVPGASRAAISAQQLATQVVLDLRGDIPNGDETKALTDEILARGPGPAVGSQLRSQEFGAHASVVRLYLGFLGRVPDETGVDFWISELHDGPNGAGRDLTTVATRFAEASQFELGARLSDREFVTRVYSTILNREPELEGLVYWTGRLGEGMPRGRLLLEVSESIEHRSSAGPPSEAIATYIRLLDRLPTTAELQNATSLIVAGRMDEFVANVVTDAEYQTRVAR